MKNLQLDSGAKYENKKYFDAMDKINKYIPLNDVLDYIRYNYTFRNRTRSITILLIY